MFVGLLSSIKQHYDEWTKEEPLSPNNIICPICEGSRTFDGMDTCHECEGTGVVLKTQKSPL